MTALTEYEKRVQTEIKDALQLHKKYVYFVDGKRKELTFDEIVECVYDETEYYYDILFNNDHVDMFVALDNKMDQLVTAVAEEVMQEEVNNNREEIEIEYGRFSKQAIQFGK